MSSPAAPSTPSAPWAVGATDPRLDAVESLFRGATGRSGLRAYEPSLRPPEGTSDYSWLYRAEESAVPALDSRATTRGLIDTGSGMVTSSGAGVPSPLVRWPAPAMYPGRRWRAAALLAVALGCALLLPWIVPTR